MKDLITARANLKCAEFWIDRGYKLEFYVSWRKLILDKILEEQLRTFDYPIRMTFRRIHHEHLKTKD